MPNIRQIKLIGKKKPRATVPDLEDETFVVYIVFFSSNSSVQPCGKVYIALSKINETLILVLFKYTDFGNVFSPNLIAKLSDHTKINNHAIDLIKD